MAGGGRRVASPCVPEVAPSRANTGGRPPLFRVSCCAPLRAQRMSARVLQRQQLQAHKAPKCRSTPKMPQGCSTTVLEVKIRCHFHQSWPSGPFPDEFGEKHDQVPMRAKNWPDLLSSPTARRDLGRDRDAVKAARLWAAKEGLRPSGTAHQTTCSARLAAPCVRLKARSCTESPLQCLKRAVAVLGPILPQKGGHAAGFGLARPRRRWPKLGRLRANDVDQHGQARTDAGHNRSNVDRILAAGAVWSDCLGTPDLANIAQGLPGDVRAAAVSPPQSAFKSAGSGPCCASTAGVGRAGAQSLAGARIWAKESAPPLDAPQASGKGPKRSGRPDRLETLPPAAHQVVAVASSLAQIPAPGGRLRPNSAPKFGQFCGQRWPEFGPLQPRSVQVPNRSGFDQALARVRPDLARVGQNRPASREYA